MDPVHRVNFPSLTDSRNILHILLRIADELSTLSFVDTLDLDQLGFGHLSQDLLNALLLQAAGPDAADYEELTGSELSVAILETLILNGADVSCRDADGSSPLYRAVLHDQLQEAEFLLEKGAQVNCLYVNADDVEGETCLTTAVQLGNVEMVRMLLRFGADMNVIDRRELLWFCATHRDLDMLTLLVGAGADIMERDSTNGFSLADAVFESAAKCECDVMDLAEIFGYDGTKLNPTPLFQDYNKGMCKWVVRNLEERIRCLKFVISTGNILPDPLQIDHALQMQSFYTVTCLYFWCLMSGISLVFPESLDGNFGAAAAFVSRPFFLCRPDVLIEMILRNESLEVRCRTVLDYLYSRCASEHAEYPVQRLKHICLVKLRKSLASSKARNMEPGQLIRCLAIPEMVKDTISMEDLRTKMEYNKELLIEDMLR